MAQQTLLGGDGTTGETGATHNSKANSNFTELYAASAAAQSTANSATTSISDHISDGTAAHAGTAIAFTPVGTITATNVQDAIAEVAVEAGATVPDASVTVKGIVELATEAETITGTDTTRAATPAGVAAKIGLKADVVVTQTSKTASYTFTDTEFDQVRAGVNLVMMMNSASAVNIEIPLDSGVTNDDWPVGGVVGVRAVGAGQVTVTSAVGVTKNAPLNAFKSAAQNALFFIEKTAANTYYVNGELVI